MMEISCLGPAGSYSDAVTAAFEGAVPYYCNSFTETLAALTGGRVQGCVLPIENSISGSVRQTLDLLAAERGVYAVEEASLYLDHRLVMREGTDPAAITRILSYEQAFSQCSRYLKEHFPAAELEYVSSTAESLNMLDGHTAAIVGAHGRREGFLYSKENISDEKRNVTRFLLLKQGKENLPAHSKKVFICVSLSHRHGALLRCLQLIDSFGLNLSKIESRPVREAPGTYRFFIEFEGDIAEVVTGYALETIEERVLSYRLLGAY